MSNTGLLRIVDMTNKLEVAEALRDGIERKCGVFIVRENGDIVHVDHETLAKAGIDAFNEVFGRPEPHGGG